MILLISVALQVAMTLDALEAKERWKPADQKAALALLPAAKDQWLSCYRATADRLEKSQEQAETIAVAVVGSCTIEESYFKRVYMLGMRGALPINERLTETDSVVQQTKRNIREQVVSEVVSARLPIAK